MDRSEIIFIALLALSLICLGILLSYLFSLTDTPKGDDLKKRVVNMLPGINCGQCGFPGCEAYAKALSQGKAKANLCKPAGPETAKAIAQTLGISDRTDDDFEEQLFMPREIAFIDECKCIGCGKCVRVCPVDAIEGKLRQAHKVSGKYCIACGDCIKVCPEHCIDLMRIKRGLGNFDWKIHTVEKQNQD